MAQSMASVSSLILIAMKIMLICQYSMFPSSFSSLAGKGVSLLQSSSDASASAKSAMHSQSAIKEVASRLKKNMRATSSVAEEGSASSSRKHVEYMKSQIHQLAKSRTSHAKSEHGGGEGADSEGLLPPDDETADEDEGNSDFGMGGDGSDLNTIPFNAAKAPEQKLYQVGKRVLGSRARGGLRMHRAHGGLMLASNSTGGEGEKEEEKHEFSWVKDWWTARAWFLWTISGPTVTVLIFVLNTLTQGWQCGLIYVGILLPLDVATYYWDIYAYDNGDVFWIELTLAMMLNCCLCACLVPAYAAYRLEEEERMGAGRGYHYGYGATYGSYPGGGGGGNSTWGSGAGGFEPFSGQGQTTGYGRVTERTQLV